MTIQKLQFILQFFILTGINAQSSSGPGSRIDSLQKCLKTAKSDSARCEILVSIGDLYQTNDPAIAYNFHRKALWFALNQPDSLLKIKVFNGMAWDHFTMANYSSASDLYLKSLNLIARIEKAGNKKDKLRTTTYKFSTLANLATVYTYVGNYSKSLEINFKSLKLAEEIKNKNSIASCLGNIGIVYMFQEDYDRALVYYIRALKIFEETGDIKNLAIGLDNIGNVYKNKGDYKNAIENFSKALEKSIEAKDNQNQAAALGNLGTLYDIQKEYEKALDYGNKALTLNEKIGNKQGQSINFGSIAEIYIALHQPAKAITFAQRGLKIAEEIESPELIKNCHEQLYSIYQPNQPDSALAHYLLFIKFRDSLLNEENTRASMQQEIKFNHEKKAAADSVMAAEDKRVGDAMLAKSEATLHKDRSTRLLLFCGLFMVIIFSLFMINRFRLTRKQKQLIEAQKKIVEEQKLVTELKQKEILDSIYYARRIQNALLTSERYIDRILKKQLK
ncbi:MAG: tetratricopeptide repeat protein [Bacteroidetes bacterium]|nr:tetratricopeptide repeat protein [Bacteroidota bacterium]